uniref:Uncharacterized protein n=1 Tax=Rhizophagus irregularis (strain DAOM 181602 / DAOM 197198 / MUCL 43194) TaxID=747089 RepID=U9UTF5_RHIID
MKGRNMLPRLTDYLQTLLHEIYKNCVVTPATLLGNVKWIIGDINHLIDINFYNNIKIVIDNDFNSYADAAKNKRGNQRRRWNQDNINRNYPESSGDEGISDWDDDDEAEYEGVKKWKGTSVGSSMHDKKKNAYNNKNDSSKSRDQDINEIKQQLKELTNLFTEFKNDNNQVKQEINKIKEGLQQNNKKKVTFNVNNKASLINNNNKRTKADSSSSENEDNDVILGLESKVDKQDQLLNKMFSMINNINGQL